MLELPPKYQIILRNLKLPQEFVAYTENLSKLFPLFPYFWKHRWSYYCLSLGHLGQKCNMMKEIHVFFSISSASLAEFMPRETQAVNRIRCTCTSLVPVGSFPLTAASPVSGALTQVTPHRARWYGDGTVAVPADTVHRDLKSQCKCMIFSDLRHFVRTVAVLWPG